MFISILSFAIIALVVKESHEALTLDVDTQLMVTAFTPFKKNGDINAAVVRKMAEKYAKDNITTIVIGGYAGEGPSMGLDVRKALVSAWVKVGCGLKIIVEVGALAFPDTLKLVKFCARVNVTAIFVLPELCYKAKTVDEIVGDFKAISNVAPELPIIFHDLQFLTLPVVSSIEVFIKLSAEIPNCVGLATSLETALQLRTVSSTKGKLIIIYTNDIYAPVSLQVGIILSTWPNLFPKLALRILAVVNSCDLVTAAKLQAELNDLIEAVTKLEGLIIDYTSRLYIECQKLAYKLITGLDLGLRLPLIDVSGIDVTKIKTGLTDLGIVLNNSVAYSS